MTQYADADMLLAMYTFDDDGELSDLNERGHVPLPVIRENIKDCIVPDVEPVAHCKDCRCAGAKNAPCFTAANAGSSTRGRRITTSAATEKGYEKDTDYR